MGLLKQPPPVCETAVEHSSVYQTKLLWPSPGRFEVVDLELTVRRYHRRLHWTEVGADDYCFGMLVRILNGPKPGTCSKIDFGKI